MPAYTIMSAVDLTLTVGDDVITPAAVVRDHGVYLDAELTMKQHVNRIARSCFFHIKRPRQIRRSVGLELTKKLVSALILSRLYVCMDRENSLVLSISHNIITMK